MSRILNNRWRGECHCFRPEWAETTFHADVQDTECDGWKRLLDLIETAAADGREDLIPTDHIPRKAWRDVVTLPGTIAKLTSVRRLVLHASNLARIPPEIGGMEHLETLNTYGSYRLHWYPYEIVRCRRLVDSCVSTRALYGNHKFRPLFPTLQPRGSTVGLDLNDLAPALWGADRAVTCSVCNGALTGAGLYQVWLSRPVATDVLPLLVNACSEACVRRLPDGVDGHVMIPHTGGPTVVQPSGQWP